MGIKESNAKVRAQKAKEKAILAAKAENERATLLKNKYSTTDLAMVQRLSDIGIDAIAVTQVPDVGLGNVKTYIYALSKKEMETILQDTEK